MKKIFTIVLTLALLAAGTTAAFAADLTDEELIAERHAEMVAEKQEWLADLVAEGVITQEEANEMLANMEERYLENYGVGLGLGAEGDNGFYRGGSDDEDRGQNEDGILQQNLNEDGVLHQNLNEDGAVGGGMYGQSGNAGQANGNSGNGGFGQSAGYDGDCVLD